MQDSPFANIPEEKPPRPVIITVFAIFTILGCAFTILSVFVPTDLFSGGLDNPPPTPPRWIAYVGGGLAVLKLLGALQMLKMRRIGFFLYAAGETSAAIISIVSARIMMDLMDGYLNSATPFDMKPFILVSTGIGLLLSLLFIGVYASQLKNMS